MYNDVWLLTYLKIYGFPYTICWTGILSNWRGCLSFLYMYILENKISDGEIVVIVSLEEIIIIDNTLDRTLDLCTIEGKHIKITSIEKVEKKEKQSNIMIVVNRI